MQQLNATEWRKARHLASRLSDEWSVIQPIDAVRARAVHMVERYDLRAADALQLAAALEWCGDAPQGRILLTGDDRLLQAAMLSGFDARRI